MLLELKVVVKLPALLPLSGTSYTWALPNGLFDCVPMPKINEPVTVEEPPSGTEGSSISTPLLSREMRSPD